MSFTGTIVNGMIVLDCGTRLPEGARVIVKLITERDTVVAPVEPVDKPIIVWSEAS